jgi:hypothetical protein
MIARINSASWCFMFRYFLVAGQEEEEEFNRLPWLGQSGCTRTSMTCWKICRKTTAGIA